MTTLTRAWARMRRTLTATEWVPLQALRWDAARAAAATGEHPEIHYYGPPHRGQFAITGSEDEIRDILLLMSGAREEWRP